LVFDGHEKTICWVYNDVNGAKVTMSQIQSFAFH
jgi:hypothetical protein